MAERGLYVPVHASFCRDRAARSLRRRRGVEGLGQYVALLCLLLDEPAHSLDVSTPDGMDDLADELGCGSREGCASLLSDMAAAGLVDAAALEGGSVICPAVEEAQRDRERLVQQRRDAVNKRWERYRAEKGDGSDG